MPASEKYSKKLHIAMFPWVGMGHITSFFHIGNELAKRGHSISLLLPKKAVLKLDHNHLHNSDLVKFHTVKVPHVDGLPLGTETCSDIEFSQNNLLAIAFDAMSEEIETLFHTIKPDVVFYDFAHWIPDLAVRVGFKTVCYNTVSAACMAYGVVPARHIPKDRPMTAEELATPPPGYPSSKVVLKASEGMIMSFIARDYGAIRFDERMAAALNGCDAIGIRTCGEMEGTMCDYVSEQYQKPVFLSGPVLPEVPEGPLEENWDTWLNKFEPKSVVYCAFGSQVVLPKKQFTEMVLGFEMTGLPFFVAAAKPQGVETVEEALPEGFLERVGDRGVVHCGWVQQTQILSHPSVGCFVSHCGFGSMCEALMSDCQIVVVPRFGDQVLNARLLTAEMKAGVEVERGEMGWFSKEDLRNAVKTVMDADSDVGKLVRENHAAWKQTLVAPGFMSNYIDNFVQQLYQL